MDKRPEPIRNVGRVKKRVDKLGADACCLLCLTAEPKVLVATPLGQLLDSAGDVSAGDTSMRAKVRHVLEEHHLLEKTIDRDVTVPLCRNCHGLVHELLRDLGIDFKADPERGTILHQIETVLRVLAFFHQQLATLLAWLADELGSFIARLDRRDPGWGVEGAI